MAELVFVVEIRSARVVLALAVKTGLLAENPGEGTCVRGLGAGGGRAVCPGRHQVCPRRTAVAPLAGDASTYPRRDRNRVDESLGPMGG